MRKLAGVLTLCAVLVAGCGGSSGGSDAAGGGGGADGTAAADTGGGGGGVTASQVQQLIADRFNNFDDSYALWKIQPGLGTVMMEYGYRFAMAYMAAQAGDWAMAQYQLKEALEIQEVGEITRSGKAELLKTFEHDHIDALVADVEVKDLGSFNADYDSALAGCNDCHKTTGHEYIVVKKPDMSPIDYVEFAASEPLEPETEEPEHNDTGTQASGGDTPLTWQELYAMVDKAFNEADRSLALWAIQPGLGTVMMEYGKRFAMARFAAEAGDWGMAQYQIKEATEIQEVGEITRPSKADPLKAFEHGSLDKLSDDILAKDLDAFKADYAAAIDGCNSCHAATGHPYVRVVSPQAQPEALLDLAASEPVAPEEGEEHGTAGEQPNFPDRPPTLADAQDLIDKRLNEMNRDLALWAIQPGLGTVMIEYGYRFATAYFAAQAGNWDMVKYQIKEATEIQEVGETTRPAKADLLKAFEHDYLDPLTEAANNQDLDAFNQAFDAAIGGCNSCHQATGHEYVRVKTPPAQPVDYLNLGQ